MAVLYFPEALNQGHATLSELLRGEALILCGCLFVGIIGYAMALVAIGLCAAFAKHPPFRVMHKASMTVGFGFAALIELYRLPFVLYRPSNLAAILGICSALLALVFSIGIAVRMVWRNTPSPQQHQLPSSYFRVAGYSTVTRI